jgi:hypothetical protein
MKLWPNYSTVCFLHRGDHKIRGSRAEEVVFRRSTRSILGLFVFLICVLLSNTFRDLRAVEGVIAVSPFTNSIPVSVFSEFDPCTQRDPFTRVGYFRPKPPKAGDPSFTARPKVDIKLKINSISSMGPASIAILDNGQMLEGGNAYDYKEGGFTISYKVLRVTDTSVVILHEDKELEFKMKGSDLNLFIEKEDSHETPKL